MDNAPTRPAARARPHLSDFGHASSASYAIGTPPVAPRRDLPSPWHDAAVPISVICETTPLQAPTTAAPMTATAMGARTPFPHGSADAAEAPQRRGIGPIRVGASGVPSWRASAELRLRDLAQGAGNIARSSMATTTKQSRDRQRDRPAARHSQQESDDGERGFPRIDFLNVLADPVSSPSPAKTCLGDDGTDDGVCARRRAAARRCTLR